MSLHDFIQAWVLMFSCLAIWCVARTDRWHRWGYVFGAVSEPAWLWAAWESQQWGVLLLCGWWGYYWIVGAYRRFFLVAD